jgi:general secretion pathway protein A
MYEQYWQFSQKPFQNDLDPNFLYFSEKHEEALVRMLYTVSEKKGLMLLVGDRGLGKTFITRIFFAELARRRYNGAFASMVEDSPAALLRQWLYALGQAPRRNDLLSLISELKEFAAAGAAGGRETVLVIDDAEHIRKSETLDMLRNLLALDRRGQRLFTIYLVGGKVVVGRLEAHSGLLDSVDLVYIMKSFSQEETRNYIVHRLHLVGGGAEIFSPDAVRLIHSLSGGVPKVINNLADMALFTAAGRGVDRIDANIVMAAKTEVLQLKGA